MRGDRFIDIGGIVDHHSLKFLFIISASITTKIVRLTLVHGEVYLIQLYVLKFVNDLQKCSCFLAFSTPFTLPPLTTTNKTDN